MLREIAARFDGEILAEAAACYGTRAELLRELEGFENYIYFYPGEGQDRVLRIGHSLRRSASSTLGEIEWVNFLADGGVPVARPIPSRAGRWVETIPDTAEPETQGYFVVAAFERAPGVVLDDEPEAKAQHWNDALFEAWGRVMGRLHARSRHFRPSKALLKRPQWHEYDVLDLDHFLPPDQTRLRARARELLDRLHALPQSDESYGLIHADLTQWNFCVDGSRITVFDFDSSEYCWYVKDIAVALYYAPASHDGDRQDAFVGRFLTHFLRGYCAEYHLDVESLRLIPEFLMLQKLILYSFCHQIWDMEKLDVDQQRYLAEARDVIENRYPVLNVDDALLDRVLAEVGFGSGERAGNESE